MQLGAFIETVRYTEIHRFDQAQSAFHFVSRRAAPDQYPFAEEARAFLAKLDPPQRR